MILSVFRFYIFWIIKRLEEQECLRHGMKSSNGFTNAEKIE